MSRLIFLAGFWDASVFGATIDSLNLFVQSSPYILVNFKEGVF